MMMMMVVVMMMTWPICGSRKEQEALLVNYILMVKATTGLQSNVLLTDLSKQACDLSVSRDATDLHMHFCSPLLHCVCLCMHCARAVKPEPYACSLFGPHDRLWCCLESRRQNQRCSPLCRSLRGRLKKTKPPPKVQSVRSLNNIHLFHYELWFSPFSCCLCCSFIQYKPPRPPQDSKASHTYSTGEPWGH